MYLQYFVLVYTNPHYRVLLFDLLSDDYIFEIPLAWELTKMGKNLEKTVLLITLVTNYDIIRRLAVIAVSSARCIRCENSCYITESRIQSAGCTTFFTL